MAARDYVPQVTGAARRASLLYEPTAPRRAVALLAASMLGACDETQIHTAQRLRDIDASAPVCLELDGSLTSDATAVEPNPPADASTVYIFVHTGQSLSMGYRADQTPRAPATVLASGHYMLAGQQAVSGAMEANSDAWTLATLGNPARMLGPGSAGQYPTNAWDEVPMVAMGARLTAIAPAVVSAHEVFGINGATIEALQAADPNQNRSFVGIATAVKALARLVRGLGKRPFVAAIVHTHGESDNGVPTYKADLGRYRVNVEEICKVATGQVGTIPMFLTQASAAWPTTVGSANTTWQDMVDLAVEQPDRFVLAGSKYHLSYDAGDFHLDVPGSRDLGYLYADAWVAWRSTRRMKPRAIVKIDRASNTLTLTYDLEDGESLAFDTSIWAGNHGPASPWPEWQNGRGFELLDAGSNVVTIASAALSGTNSIILTGAAPWPAGTLYLTYAYYSDAAAGVRRGQVRTSSGRWAPHSFATVP